MPQGRQVLFFQKDYAVTLHSTVYTALLFSEPQINLLRFKLLISFQLILQTCSRN